MQTPPRFDFGPATPPTEGGITPPPPPGANPPYFPPPQYRDEVVSEKPSGFSFSRLLPTLITLSAFGGLALLGWFAYQEGRKPMGDDEVPVVKAESDSFKREPENPGGEEIPHMDKEVYNTYSDGDKSVADKAPKPSAEHNPAEQPVDRAFLKQFAGTSDEDAVDGESTAGKESVAFGQKPKVVTGDEQVKTESAMQPQAEDVPPAAAPKPLTDDSFITAVPPPTRPAISEETRKRLGLDANEENVRDAAPAPSVQPLAEAPVADATTTTEVKKAPEPVVIQNEPVAKPATKKTETAKLKAEVKTTSAKPIKAGDLRVQLGSFKTEADAKKEWKRLSSKHKSILSGLSSKVEKATVADKGTMYRLQAGPVKNRDAGRALCKKLSDAGVGCFIAK